MGVWHGPQKKSDKSNNPVNLTFTVLINVHKPLDFDYNV